MTNLLRPYPAVALLPEKVQERSVLRADNVGPRTAIDRRGVLCRISDFQNSAVALLHSPPTGPVLQVACLRLELRVCLDEHDGVFAG